MTEVFYQVLLSQLVKHTEDLNLQMGTVRAYFMGVSTDPLVPYSTTVTSLPVLKLFSPFRP